MLEREFNGYPFSVASTAIVGQGVYKTLPVLAWLQQALDYLKPFSKIRMKSIRVRIVPVGANSAMRGCLRVSWTKSWDALLAGDGYRYDLYRASTVDNQILPFSSTEGISFTIPWVYHEPFMPINKIFTSLAQNADWPTGVYVGVDQPLANTTGSVCSLNFKVFLQAEGVELYEPVLATITPANHPLTDYAYHTLAYAFTNIGAYSGPKGEAVKKSETGLISGVAKTVAKASSLLAPVDPSGSAGALASIASNVGTVAEMFGLDKPTSLDFASFASLRLGDHLLTCEGLDPSLVANVKPDASDITDFAMYGETCDPWNIQTFASKFSVLTTGTTNPAATAGSVIADIPINPTLKVSAGDHRVFATNLAYVTSFFSHWCGDLRYRFTVAQDIFFNANLYIALINRLGDSSTLSTVSYTQLNKLRYTAVNVSGTTVIEFTIPWHNLSEWDLTAVQDATKDYHIVIGLLDPAKRQGVDTTFNWTLEVAASDVPGRFLVAEPTSYNPAFTYGNFGDGASVNMRQLGNTAIVPMTTMFDLMKRYTLQPSQSPAAVRYLKPRFTPDNLLGIALAPFKNYRGSWRVTVYLPSNRKMYGTLKNPKSSQQPTFSNTGSASGSVVKNYDYNPEAPIEFHYLGTQRFSLISELSSALEYNYLEYQLLDGGDSPDDEVPVIEFHSVGDDFTCGNRRQLPWLY